VSSTRSSRRRPARFLIVLLAIAFAAGLAAVAAPLGAGASPKPPRPTLATVLHRLDRLAGTAERLTEQYNAGRLHAEELQRELAAARADKAAADREFADERRQLMPLIVSQYESGGLGPVSAILTSSDPGAYIDQLATQAMITRHWADVLDGVQESARRAQVAGDRAAERLAAARRAQATLDAKRAAVHTQITKYHQLFAALTASQRAAYANRDAPTAGEITHALATPAPSKAARRAVEFAVAQVGKPYIWAAAGPDGFDCSGLTMAAWARAGVSLPHFSAAQYTHGRHVGFADLEPGDLVFLYGDIHHVEMYVGGGLAISAPQEGEDIKFVRVADYRDVFYGATRLG
jgi:cell wall-associated NlpC family hydrolase